MKVINLWGGPGAGKSTTAADLFRLMKLRGHRVELITEYAKELTYDQDWVLLQRQEKILPEQYKRQRRLKGHVDYAITDSPIPLNIIYARDDLKKDPCFSELVLKHYREFDNFNVIIKRVKPYSHYGRKETSDEAREIDSEIKAMLDKIKEPYHTVRGDEDGAVMIYNILINNYEIVLNENN